MDKLNYNLFLDDVRMPTDCFYMGDSRYFTEQWTIVRDFDQFVACITKRGLPTVVSFDHDLHVSHYAITPDNEEQYIKFLRQNSWGKHKTGYDCALRIASMVFCHPTPHQCPDILCHSQSIIGRSMILNLFK